MTKITKLPDEWRRTLELPAGYDNRIHSQGYDAGKEAAARELQADLPTWTKISDDPDTWPDDGTYLWVYGSNTCDYLHATYDVCMMRVVADMVKHVYWRPLCDLDYPPKDAS